MKNSIVKLSAVALSALFVLGVGASAQANTAVTNMSYIVAAHPDDEWMTWGMVENSPMNYKVFISATRGEQTGYCTSPAVGTHPAPTPYPTGKWTPECESARLNSWVGFFDKMSQTDSSIPGSLQDLGTVGPFPANGVLLQVDDGAGLVAASRTARVWVDTQGRGAAISFDLGDGDLTSAEVKWAVDTVRNNRAAFGLNTTLQNYNAIGVFSNTSNTGCVVYPHADHKAVHQALWNNKLGVVYRAAATCKSDVSATRHVTVSDSSVATAWGSEGAFPMMYGWLGMHTLSDDQSNVFMRNQSFWSKY